MHSPFYFFDQIYVINLESRLDRWRLFQKETDKYNLNVEKINGVIYTEFKDKKRNACVGNHLAHAECIRKAMKEKANNVLIFEDDVEFFLDKEKTEEILTNAISDLPKDWGLFYLGINMDRFYAHRYGKYLARLDGGFSTHAYAINGYLFDTILKINLDTNVIHNDVYYAENVHNKFPCLVTNPLLIGQRMGYSDIMGCLMNSNDIFLQRFKDKLI